MAFDLLGGACPPLMSDDLYRRFSALIHDRTGLSFGESSRFFLEKRLEGRTNAVGAGSFEEYFEFLRFDPERGGEWDALIVAVTTNETYFLREERQLRCFQHEILPALHQRANGAKIRVWSAGCSSGEEPYTLAMLVREARQVPEGAVEIYATDINPRVLAKAREGLYTENSFRGTDAAFRARWFTAEGEGKWRVREEIRRAVTFARFNLFDLERYSLLAPFDVIFCRNVIIYFDLEVKVKVVDRFHDRLKTGGYLLLGHSESLISVTDKLRLVHLATDLVYVKGGA